MSLESWKAEFYPIRAENVPKEDALEHSIRKWEGLRKENLEKHGLYKDCTAIYEESSFRSWYISSDSCALCHQYLNPNGPFTSERDKCKECPLFKTNGNCRCDRSKTQSESLFSSFTIHDNPEPMIEALKKAREYDC